jgi:hypothetical protein
MPKQTQSVGSKKTRRRRRGRKQGKGSGPSIKTETVPASFGSTISNIGQFSTTRAASHPEWGVGVRVVGTSLVCNVLNPDAADIAANGPGPFSGFVTDSRFSNSPEWIILNPNFIDASGRLSQEASLYSRFVFRNLRFRYIPMCPTTTNSGLVLGMSSDYSVVAEFTPSFITVSSMKPSSSVPFWKESMLDFKYNGSTCYFTDVPDVFVPDPRLYSQGALIGYVFGSPPATTVSCGVLVSDYVIDFYSPVPPQSAPELLAAIKRLKSEFKLERPRRSIVPQVSAPIPIPQVEVKNSLPLPGQLERLPSGLAQFDDYVDLQSVKEGGKTAMPPYTTSKTSRKP